MRESDLRPQIDAVIAGIGDVRIGEGEVFFRFRIERRSLGERDFLAVLLLDLRVNLLVIDDLLFVRRGRREEHEEIVSFFRRHFRRGARIHLGDRHVVDDHVRVVLCTPLLGERAVEPFVIPGDEVTPLDDLQGFLLCQRSLREEKGRGHSRRRHGAARQLDELPASDLSGLLRHGDPPSFNGAPSYNHSDA